MRKIVLFKAFEKAIIGNYPVATVEYDKLVNYYDFIITNVESLAAKKQYYYDNLNDVCVFKDNVNKSVIAIYEGTESIEIHKNDYLNISRDS